MDSTWLLLYLCVFGPRFRPRKAFEDHAPKHLAGCVHMESCHQSNNAAGVCTGDKQNQNSRSCTLTHRRCDKRYFCFIADMTFELTEHVRDSHPQQGYNWHFQWKVWSSGAWNPTFTTTEITNRNISGDWKIYDTSSQKEDRSSRFWINIRRTLYWPQGFTDPTWIDHTRVRLSSNEVTG